MMVRYRAKHTKRSGSIYRYLKEHGLRSIIRRLNAGEKQDVLAAEIGITRQGLSDWLKRNVPLSERKRLCAYCGKLLAPEKAWSAWYHPECVYPSTKARIRANSEFRQWRPRKRLWHFQEVALAEYEQRGYVVEWVPYLAQFTFTVNGLRVAVKGCTFGEACRIYQWALRPWHMANRLGYENLPERCDLFHCIGEHKGEYVHLILTAEEAGKHYRIAFRPPEYCTGRKPNKNSKYLGRWELFEV